MMFVRILKDSIVFYNFLQAFLSGAMYMFRVHTMSLEVASTRELAKITAWNCIIIASVLHVSGTSL